MNEPVVLRVTGEVARARELTFADLRAIDARHQVPDVGELAPGRRGEAVTLRGVLELVEPRAGAKYLGLHAAADDFHASIPLAPVWERGLLIYARDGRPLAPEAGGPARFFIPDHDACRASEIDECANVKFVDHLELTERPGFDNRPRDEAEHARLHREQGED
jgi:DMSO/TMAO reductase YedYZ molybdopterin-dependent catalytic subunit